MESGNRRSIDQHKNPEAETEDLHAQVTANLLSDVHAARLSSAAPVAPQAEASKDTAADVSPSLDPTARSQQNQAVLPWDAVGPQSAKEHMSYEQTRDGIVKLGQGPHQAAERLLGKGARSSDVALLSQAMREQYLAETHGTDPDMRGLRIGHSLINEGNIAQVLNRIEDPAAKRRIAEHLQKGWTTDELPLSVPFGPDGRPDETRPSEITNSAQFMKDLAAAAIDVDASGFRSKGECAEGARLALNELPDWHIDGGSVDRSINKDPNGWRSGLQLALDLKASGLFDSVPLSQIGAENLKDGYILGRYHNPDIVKQNPSWGGEDMGDIDIKTAKHTPPPDDSWYRDSFVLIPKGPSPKP